MTYLICIRLQSGQSLWRTATERITTTIALAYRKQKQPAFSGAPFARWWGTVTDKAFVEPATFQFAQAWVAADRATKGSGQLNPNSSGGNWMSYSQLARFFDNFHMPLLPPEINERFLLKSLGMN
jgi:hypothetical protein